jgi:hypothetical protein
MCSLLRPSVILLISLLVIYLVVSDVAVARMKGKTGLGSFLYYLGVFSTLYTVVFADESSLLPVMLGSRFLNPINNSAIPCF